MLVNQKRGTRSFTSDRVHTSVGCSTMLAEEERQAFITNLCLSCLPSCLYLRYCEQLGRPLLSRLECLTSPGASLLRKIIINSPCQIRREHQGRKESHSSRGCSGMPLIPSVVRYGRHFNFSNHRAERSSNV